MNILITGHFGFIGKWLVDELTEYNLQGYDLIFGSDIRDKFRLYKLFSQNKFNYVIHLAARAGVRDSKLFPDEYISTNINGTQNIVELCEEFNVKLIFFSSSSVLGGGDKLKESAIYNPRSLYAVTKMAGEYLFKNADIEGTIIRPFTVYGEDGRKDMVVYKWINQIKNNEPITFYGDGDSSRGYTYVRDLTNGIKQLIKKDLSGKNILNLGGNEIITLNELLAIFQEYSKKIKINEIPRLKEDVKNASADISFAKELIGYNPKGQFKNHILSILKQEL